MRFVSVFTGIGGLDLGLERAGHTCIGQIEYAPYPNQILQRHWPTTPRIHDVHHYHGTEFGPFQLLIGGYPCQPFSHAGNRHGTNDDRHLWPQMHRIIRAVRPQYALLENVTGHLTLGFDTVLADLAASGYDTIWDCIPASALGAPHHRDRLFILAKRQARTIQPEHQWPLCSCCGNAYCETHECHEHECDCITLDTAIDDGDRIETHPTLGLLAYPNREPQHRLQQPSRTPGSSTTPPPRAIHPLDESPRTPPRSDWLPEPDVGRMADGIPHRVDRLRVLGNAVVPQVAEWIARTWLPPATPHDAIP